MPKLLIAFASAMLLLASSGIWNANAMGMHWATAKIPAGCDLVPHSLQFTMGA